MNEIQRVLRRAGWRLFLVDLPQTFTVAASAALLALIIARIVERVGGFVFPWQPLFIGAGVAAVLGAVVWSLVRRARGLRLAREVDERAGLRESLSTALCVADQDDPWSQAVVRTARDRATSVKIRQCIPATTPRLAPVPMGLAIALLVVWLTLPVFDLSGAAHARAEDEEQKLERIEATTQVTAMQQKMKELLRKAKIEEDLEDFEPTDAENAEMTAEQVRRAALKKLTKVEEQLKAAQDSMKAKQAEAMKSMMRQLRQPGPGPLDEFSQALSKGDFGEALEKLEEAMQKLDNSELSKEEQERMKEQFKNLGEQLQKLAEQRQEIEKALQEAGMSEQQAKQAASDPQKLEQAIKQLENLTPAQQESLINQLKSQAQACQQCENMGAQAQAASQAASSEAMMDPGAAMGGMLSDMEMMQQEMAGISSALAEAQQQMDAIGQSMNPGMGKPGMSGWRPGESMNEGLGSGGPGRGQGLSPDGKESPFNTRREKSSSKKHEGPIIGQRLVYGDQIRGESRAAFSQALEAAEDAAAEALVNNTVEREYHESVQRYYDSLMGREQAGEGEQTPADDSKDASGGDG